MSAIKMITAMLVAASIPYKEVMDGQIKALDINIPRGGGRMVIGFSDKGAKFYDSRWTPPGGKSEAVSRVGMHDDLGAGGATDIENLFDVLGESNKGEVFYAESPDGALCAAVWVPTGSNLASLFVCDGDDGSFLGVFGAELQ